MTELLPCPFCGGLKIRLVGSRRPYWMALCDGCGANGGLCHVHEEAVATWNTRAPIVIDDAMVERAAFAMERANNPQWTDAQFDTWWSRDPFFCEHRTAWTGFRGTRKGKVLWEARLALEAAFNPQGKG